MSHTPHTVNPSSEMIGALYISGKNIFWSTDVYKNRERKKMTSYIVLLSYQLNSTGQSAHLGQMAGAGWLVA